MRILRICSCAAFAVILAVFLFFYIREERNTDATWPVITIEEQLIDVSLRPTDEELMKGITAYDGKDGDITEKLVVESISRFTEPGISTVTYAVCDSDQHVSVAIRKIRYIGYTSPQFYMNRSLVFSVAELPDIGSVLGAKDSIDGDISDRIIITASDYASNTIGVFSISAQVSNSKGDTIYLDLPVYIEDISAAAPKITLSEYLVCLEAGEAFDPAAYLDSAAAGDGTELTAAVWTESSLDSNTEGVYSVHYYVTDSAGRQGHTVLTVLIENTK